MAAVASAAALIACSGSTAEPTPAATAKAVVTSSPAAAATATATATGTAAAAAGPVVVNVAQVAGAATLVEGKGLTLYTFKNDTTAGKSACNGACATNWPPLVVGGTPTKGTGVTGELGTITRDDGSKQVTYKGAPLYRFASDAAAGDAKGAAIANWAVALP